MTNTYSVYFRTGGTANFQWQFVGELFATAEAAREKASSLIRAGYPAHYAKSEAIRSIGLPETYE